MLRLINGLDEFLKIKIMGNFVEKSVLGDISEEIPKTVLEGIRVGWV